MAIFNVEVEGRVREQYSVEASSEEEAREIVEYDRAGKPWTTEWIEAEIVNVVREN